MKFKKELKIGVFVVVVLDAFDDIAHEGADTMLLFVSRFIDSTLLWIRHDSTCCIGDFGEAILDFDLCLGRFCVRRIAEFSRDGFEGLFVGTEVHVGVFAYFATH